MICSQILFAWIWVLVRILQDWKRFFWPVLDKKYFVSPAPGSSMTISVGEHWSGEDGPWRLLTVCSGDTHTIANLLFLQRNALRGISISFLWDSHVSTPDQTQNLFTFASPLIWCVPVWSHDKWTDPRWSSSGSVRASFGPLILTSGHGTEQYQGSYSSWLEQPQHLLWVGQICYCILVSA